MQSVCTGNVAPGAPGDKAEHDVQVWHNVRNEVTLFLEVPGDPTKHAHDLSFYFFFFSLLFFLSFSVNNLASACRRLF